MEEELSKIQNLPERASNLLKTLITTEEYPEIRSQGARLLFKMPLGKDGINEQHLISLVELYLSSTKAPRARGYQNREFITPFILQSRLLDFIGAILQVDGNLYAEIPDIPPVQRLEKLLGSVSSENQYSKALMSSVISSKNLVNETIKRNNASDNPAPPKIEVTPNPAKTNDTTMFSARIIALLVAVISLSVLIKVFSSRRK